MNSIQKETVAQGFDPLSKKKQEKEVIVQKQEKQILFSSDIQQDFFSKQKIKLINQNEQKGKLSYFDLIKKDFKNYVFENEQQVIQTLKCIFLENQVQIIITNYNFIISGDIQVLLEQNRLNYFIFPLQYILSLDKYVDKKTNQGYLNLILKDQRCYQFKFYQKDLDFLEQNYNQIVQQCLIDIDKKNQLLAFSYKPKYKQIDAYDIEKEFLRQKLHIFKNNQYKNEQLKYLDNSDYKYCLTYPSLIVLPFQVTEQNIQKIIKFRSLGRLPALTYGYFSVRKQKHIYLWRCAQSMTGAVGNRSQEDEQLFQLLGQKITVYDARSWVAAKANMLNGKGTENIKYYTNIDLQFLDIENIHKVRDSYKKIKLACSDQDNDKWFQNIFNSEWYDLISKILQGSIKVAQTLQKQEKNVVVHCSDGWDRTSQLCALAQIILDPFFRTIQGFMILIEKDFISFGHQFQKRNQHFKSSEESQRAPIFIQFLDSVYQILHQFPFSFQFNSKYLEFLAYHQYSCQFGTFLEDNYYSQTKIKNQTVSIWSYIEFNKTLFINPIYDKEKQKLFIYPQYKQKCLNIWKEHFFYFDKDFFDQYNDIYQEQDTVFSQDHINQKITLEKQQLQMYKEILNKLYNNDTKNQQQIKEFQNQYGNLQIIDQK